MCRCNKSPYGCTYNHAVQIVELEDWLKDHPDADIEAVREVRRKLEVIKQEQLKILES